MCPNGVTGDTIPVMPIPQRAQRLLIAVVAVLFAFAGLVVAAPGPAQAAPEPTEVVSVVRDCAGAKQIQPRTLSSIFCGDAGVIVSDITWPIWVDGFAVGYGTEHRKLCRPDCATGGVATRPVGVYLFAPERGNFTRVSLYGSPFEPPITHRLTGYVPR